MPGPGPMHQNVGSSIASYVEGNVAYTQDLGTPPTEAIQFEPWLRHDPNWDIQAPGLRVVPDSLTLYTNRFLERFYPLVGEVCSDQTKASGLSKIQDMARAIPSLHGAYIVDVTEKPRYRGQPSSNISGLRGRVLNQRQFVQKHRNSPRIKEMGRFWGSRAVCTIYLYERNASTGMMDEIHRMVCKSAYAVYVVCLIVS